MRLPAAPPAALLGPGLGAEEEMGDALPDEAAELGTGVATALVDEAELDVVVGGPLSQADLMADG